MNVPSNMVSNELRINNPNDRPSENDRGDPIFFKITDINSPIVKNNI